MAEKPTRQNLVDLSRARSTVINWPNQLAAIVDGYRNYRGVPHGVQKDAVQNSWDARVDKKRGKGWVVTFELIKSKKEKNFLIITDEGTTGLTGRILKPEELQQDLSVEERWGRFENVAFTKAPSEEALGSRGRGKFIFLGASKHEDTTHEGEKFQNLILYDTLREDGSYRFGYRTLVLTDSPIDAFDNDEGKERLREYTGGVIEPLKTIGARVIIVDPIDELIEDIESGKFVEYIGETWWEIIEKYDAKIEVRSGGKVWRAEIPKDYALPTKDSRSYKVWITKNILLPVKGGYRIKTLHIVRKMGGPVPEELQGVAIQRGGMKVCSILIKYVPKEVTDSVYGYITFDKKLDHAIKADENPEHYGFDFKRSLPRAVKQYIEDELAKFAREKLGLGVDPRKVQHEKQSNAEQRAVYAINKIANKLGLLGKKGVGPPPLPPPPPPPPPVKELSLDIPPLELPRESRRVNYGEVVKNIRLIAKNNTKASVKIGIKMYLLFEDTELTFYIKKDVVEIDAGDSQEFGPFEQYFTEGEFPGRGKYTIRARAVSLEGKRKGDILDEVSRHFFLEQDPPEKGLFEKCEALDFPEEMEKITGEAVAGEAGGYIFQYNNNHPAKKAVDDDEDTLTDYLVAVMANEIPWIDLRREKPTQFTEEEIESPDATAKKISKIIGEILYNYYSA